MAAQKLNTFLRHKDSRLPCGAAGNLNLKGRSLLSWLDYSAEEIRFLLDLSSQLKQEKNKKLQRFAGMSVALIFEKR